MTTLPYEEWVGRRVTALTVAGNLYNRGTIIAYTPAPTFSIQTDQGKKFSWHCDQCLIDETTEDKLRNALEVTTRALKAWGQWAEYIGEIEFDKKGWEELIVSNNSLLGLDEVTE